MVVPIVSLKGGVGKSTFAMNLADVLSVDNKVLLIDTDQQNSVSFLFCKSYDRGFSDVMFKEADIKDVIIKVYNDSSLYIIPTGKFAITHPIEYEEKFNYNELKKIIEKIKNRFDFIIFDTSPRISKPVLSILSLADFFIVVITPDPASVASLKVFLDNIKHNGIEADYSLVVNAMEPSEINEDFYSFIQAITHNNILGTLPKDNVVLEASGHCSSVRRYDKDSAFYENMLVIAKKIKEKNENSHND